MRPLLVFMKTIREIAEATFIEKKSRFIAKIAPVKSEQEALDFIAKVRVEHKKARHHCYAYIINGGIIRKNDDGEPGGTAGMPIIGVLQHHDLCDVVCVVTRYFGGILLGKGGLIRAYSKSTALACTECTKISL